MEFLCAPEGPAKGERLRAKPAAPAPPGRPRALHQPAEIMRMPAKKCEIESKQAAICEKPDLLIV